jgi:hypothetical protein
MAQRAMNTVIRGAGSLLAVSSAVLHGTSLNGLALGMAAACLYCAYELWRFDTVRSWVLVAVMNIAMIGAHLLTTSSHHHGVDPAATAAAPTIGMGVAMGLATVVAAVEILFAATVLFVRTRAPR